MRARAAVPCRFLLAALLLVGWASSAGAHAVTHRVTYRQAVVVTATYADGEPLSFERCEVTPPDSAAVLLAGRTDRFGRVVFVPDRPGDWRVRVWSEDGHGLDLRVPVPASLIADTASVSSPPGEQRGPGVPRLVRIIIGVVILMAVAWLVAPHRRGGRP